MLRRLKDVLRVGRLKDSRYVLVHYKVVQMIISAVHTCQNQPESGGILLGSLRGPHLEITDFTRPAGGDWRSMTSFVRQDPSHQRAASAAWGQSGRTVGFLGEWHTHPSGPPIPSSVDRASWADMTRKSQYPMFFLLASPGGWRGFLTTRTRASVLHTEMVEHERGMFGLVLRQ
jgi:integrative and conjugative element protein (TIGR02256 family)